MKGASELLTRLSSMLEVRVKYLCKQAAESSLAALHMVLTTAAQLWRPFKATGRVKLAAEAPAAACMRTGREITHHAGPLCLTSQRC